MSRGNMHMLVWGFVRMCDSWRRSRKAARWGKKDEAEAETEIVALTSPHLPTVHVNVPGTRT